MITGGLLVIVIDSFYIIAPSWTFPLPISIHLLNAYVTIQYWSINYRIKLLMQEKIKSFFFYVYLYTPVFHVEI